MLLFVLTLLLLFTQGVPIVVWHGLGDDCCRDEGMRTFLNTLKAATERPVYTIKIGKDTRQDRWNSLFDDANEQVRQVCTDLKRQPQLRGGFDAIGLSQGGQLMRAYVERCNDPPVRRLITFGAQHYGVILPPGCLIERDNNNNSTTSSLRSDNVETKWKLKYPKCHWWKRILTSPLIVYSERVQRHILPAQYYRDPKHLQLYLRRNHFLADINNEHPDRKNTTYRGNLAKLDKFVMYKFTEERAVVPPDSSWFGHVDGKGDLIGMRESALYRADWIGLRELDEAGKLLLLTVPGPHMNITKEFITNDLVNVLQ